MPGSMQPSGSAALDKFIGLAREPGAAPLMAETVQGAPGGKLTAMLIRHSPAGQRVLWTLK